MDEGHLKIQPHQIILVLDLTDLTSHDLTDPQQIIGRPNTELPNSGVT